jgi:hypothetical protein
LDTLLYFYLKKNIRGERKMGMGKQYIKTHWQERLMQRNGNGGLSQ